MGNIPWGGWKKNSGGRDNKPHQSDQGSSDGEKRLKPGPGSLGRSGAIPIKTGGKKRYEKKLVASVENGGGLGKLESQYATGFRRKGKSTGRRNIPPSALSRIGKDEGHTLNRIQGKEEQEEHAEDHLPGRKESKY